VGELLEQIDPFYLLMGGGAAIAVVLLVVLLVVRAMMRRRRGDDDTLPEAPAEAAGPRLADDPLDPEPHFDQVPQAEAGEAAAEAPAEETDAETAIAADAAAPEEAPAEAIEEAVPPAEPHPVQAAAQAAPPPQHPPQPPPQQPVPPQAITMPPPQVQAHPHAGNGQGAGRQYVASSGAPPTPPGRAVAQDAYHPDRRSGPLGPEGAEAGGAGLRWRRRNDAPLPGHVESNIQRTMRAGEPADIEVRLTLAPPPGAPPPYGDGYSEQLPAQAIASSLASTFFARVRTAEGTFTVENRAPETQWVDVHAQGAPAVVVWRWRLTPLKPGHQKLHLVMTSRTIEGDGGAMINIYPEQAIDVVVASRRGGGLVQALIAVLALAFGAAGGAYLERTLGWLSAIATWVRGMI